VAHLFCSCSLCSGSRWFQRRLFGRWRVVPSNWRLGLRAAINTCHEPVRSSNLLRPWRVIRAADGRRRLRMPGEFSMKATLRLIDQPRARGDYYGLCKPGKARAAEARALVERPIILRTCGNPDCSNTIDSACGSRARFANGVFCSSRCTVEFLLWVFAAAHCKTRSASRSVL
jgi:hypothetical protein